MTPSNLAYWSEDDESFFCEPCNRLFNSDESLHQHCRDAATHDGKWCERCERLFVSSKARQDHINASRQHWECDDCSDDFSTESELLAHSKEAHFECSKCHDRFDSLNALTMVSGRELNHETWHLE